MRFLPSRSKRETGEILISALFLVALFSVFLMVTTQYLTSHDNQISQNRQKLVRDSILLRVKRTAASGAALYASLQYNEGVFPVIPAVTAGATATPSTPGTANPDLIKCLTKDTPAVDCIAYDASGPLWYDFTLISSDGQYVVSGGSETNPAFYDKNGMPCVGATNPACIFALYSRFSPTCFTLDPATQLYVSPRTPSCAQAEDIQILFTIGPNKLNMNLPVNIQSMSSQTSLTTVVTSPGWDPLFPSYSTAPTPEPGASPVPVAGGPGGGGGPGPVATPAPPPPAAPAFCGTGRFSRGGTCHEIVF